MSGRKLLTSEEAVELFFSLPDDPTQSDADGDSSSDEDVIPELAPVENTVAEGDEDAAGPSTGATSKKRKTYERKKPKKRRRRTLEVDSFAEAQHEEDEVDATGSSWCTDLPSEIVKDPPDRDPRYSEKLTEASGVADVFGLYFDEEVLDTIVLETNRYAHQKRRAGWKNLTTDELKAYLGMLFLMSVHPVHHVYLYWSTDKFFNVSEISNVMTFKRFQAIMNSLHLNNHELEKKRGEDGFDKLSKVRPLVTALSERFLREYAPSTHQSIDESMIPFKGRSSLKQYMPMKPIKRGYKVWCRADSETGYLLEFQIYEGKDAKRPPDLPLGEHVVLSLSHGIEENSQLFFDNYFTSTKLMEKLREQRVLAAGTFRPTRKDLPIELNKECKLQKGQHLWWSKGCVTATQWRDNKNVHAMSNYHDPQEIVEVTRKLASGAKVGVSCPKVLSDYNKWMGGVDRFDQKRNTYPADRKSKKWWCRIFYYLLDAAAVNAFIQYKSLKEVDYMQFRLMLGRQLISRQTFREKRTVAAFMHKKRGNRSGQAMVGVPSELRFQGSGHHAQKISKRRRCRWCSTRTKESRTQYICKSCAVPLCVECFAPFHSEQ
ncbi:piggyBac transposable element-derived protein 4-like [Ixodes scapularis]